MKELARFLFSILLLIAIITLPFVFAVALEFGNLIVQILGFVYLFAVMGLVLNDYNIDVP